MLIAFAATGLISCTKSPAPRAGTDSTAVAEVYWTCPMHPSVHADKPGACPVCGMALVKKSAADHAGVDTSAPGSVTISPRQRVLANISTVAAERRPFSREIGAVGVIAVAEPLQASVTARFRGRIEKLHVDATGATVRAGQPLFELHSPDVYSAAQELIIARAALTAASASGDATAENLQQGLFDAARTRLRIHFGLTDSQVEELSTMHEAHPTITYYSPMAGTVVRKEVVAGQYVDEGTVLYQIADYSRVWVYLDVAERDLRSVNVGQSMSIRTVAYPDETFTARITFIDPTMNAETRTVRVRAELPNPGLRLKPSMYITAAIASPRRNAIVVPAAALISTGSRNVVWVEAAPNTFEPRDVGVGDRADGMVEIVSGLAEGEHVASTGAYLIDSESSLSAPAKQGGRQAPTPMPGMEMK
jgi:Cu(I)/Ag(I) efflux system membrane fusion protein